MAKTLNRPSPTVGLDEEIDPALLPALYALLDKLKGKKKGAPIVGSNDSDLLRMLADTLSEMPGKISAATGVTVNNDLEDIYYGLKDTFSPEREALPSFPPDEPLPSLIPNELDPFVGKGREYGEPYKGAASWFDAKKAEPKASGRSPMPEPAPRPSPRATPSPPRRSFAESPSTRMPMMVGHDRGAALSMMSGHDQRPVLTPLDPEEKVPLTSKQVIADILALPSDSEASSPEGAAIEQMTQQLGRSHGMGTPPAPGKAGDYLFGGLSKGSGAQQLGRSHGIGGVEGASEVPPDFYASEVPPGTEAAAPPPQAVAPPPGAPPAPAPGGAAAGPTGPPPQRGISAPPPPQVGAAPPAPMLGGGPLGLSPNPEAATEPGTLMPEVGPGEGGGWSDSVGNNAGEAGGKQGPGGILGNLSKALDLNSPSGQALFTTAMGLMSGKGKNFLDVAGQAGAGGMGVYNEAQRYEDVLELRQEQERARRQDEAWRRTVQNRQWDWQNKMYEHTLGREGVADARALSAEERAQAASRRADAAAGRAGEAHGALMEERDRVKNLNADLLPPERQAYIDQLTAKLANTTEPTQINDIQNAIATFDSNLPLTRAEAKALRKSVDERQVIKQGTSGGWDDEGGATTGEVTGADLAARKQRLGVK